MPDADGNGAPGAGGNDDDALFAQLGDALDEAAGTPPSFASSGRALFTWRTVDAELATLTYDSATDRTPALVRATEPGPRSLTYEGAGLVLELDLADGAVRGQLTGDVRPSDVRFEAVDHAPVTAVPDAVGYFAITPFPLVAVRFRVRAGALVTPWIEPTGRARES